MKSLKVVKGLFCFVVLLFVLSGFAHGDTHQDVQSVDEDGYGDHPDLLTGNKVTVEGIILNRSDYMSDTIPDEDYPGPGPWWQFYIQGEGDDHGGTAVWMGQCYDNLPGGDGTYTNQEWLNEIYRLSHDPCTGYEFAPGDRVRATGLLKFYKGKTNINEWHNTNPDNDVTIELLEAAVGLPQSEVITLGDVKDANEYIFDYTGATGCEYYQARLVRVNDVNIIDPENWGPDNTVTVIDACSGLTFPVKLGVGAGFSKYDCPAGLIDVIGIFDQESWDPKSDYRIWVMNYDGNSRVLTDRGYGRYNMPGEINMDGKVDLMDFAWLADNWLECVPGSGACVGSN